MPKILSRRRVSSEGIKYPRFGSHRRSHESDSQHPELGLGNEAVFVPAARAVIAADHRAELACREADPLRDSGRQRLREHALGKPVVGRPPTLADVEKLLRGVDALAGTL